MLWIGPSEARWRFLLEECSRWIQWRIGYRCPWKYYFLWRIYATVVAIYQDIVDKSSPWISESASHAMSLQLAPLLHHPPLFPPSSPCPSPRSLSVQKFSKSRWIASFHIIFGRPLFLFPGIFVLNSFFISPRHMPLPVRHSLSNLLRSMHHSCCPS